MHLSWLDPHKMRKITVVGTEKMVVFDDMELERKVTVYEKAPWRPSDRYGEWQTRTGDIFSPRIANDEPLQARVHRVPAPRRRRRATARRSPRDGRASCARSTCYDLAVAMAEIHPTATVHPGTVLGEGVKVLENAVVGKQPVALAPLDRQARAAAADGDRRRNDRVDGRDRLRRDRRIGARVILGDQSCVRERVTIGDDVVLGRGSLVENDTTIGAMTKIQAEAYITAYSTLEEHVFIAPCVVTTNDNFMGRTEQRHELMKGPTIRRGARVGGGAVLCPGIEIGEEAFVGAGAVVTKDVPPRTIVVGNPARVLREVPEDELLQESTCSSRERRPLASSQKRGYPPPAPIRRAKATVPMPTVPPSGEADCRRRQLEHAPNDADPCIASALRPTTDRRIARTGTEPGAEVDRSPAAHQRDSEREQGDPEPRPRPRATRPSSTLVGVARR